MIPSLVVFGLEKKSSVEEWGLCVEKQKGVVRSHLPGHLVGLVTTSQAEGASEVAGEHVDLLDVGNQGLVDSLLVSSTAAVDLLLLCGESQG